MVGNVAEDDIYKSKQRYVSRWVDRLEELTQMPQGVDGRGHRRYWCRNVENLKYFRQLHEIFEARDTSYVHRSRVFQTLLFISAQTACDLRDCSRTEINSVVAAAHRVYLASSSKRSFLKSLKWLWKMLFPELDEKGREDASIVPYPVRHILGRVDKSRDRLRNERLTPEDVRRLLGYFSSDRRMQAFIALAIESLGRPQELCLRRIKDLELHDSYGRVWISSHGKEGTGFLVCIDSYPYLLRWYEEHPYPDDPEAFLFLAATTADRPMTPSRVNQLLRRACKALGIEKRITGYSLKRNGVTFRRLRGDSDLEIQHVARWTSTKQLQTYDLSGPEDSFRGQLVKRGLAASAAQDEQLSWTPRRCLCGSQLTETDKVCHRCMRVVGGGPGLDTRAEPAVRQLLALAMEHPDLNLAGVLEKWGNPEGAGVVPEGSDYSGEGRPPTAPSSRWRTSPPDTSSLTTSAE